MLQSTNLLSSPVVGYTGSISVQAQLSNDGGFPEYHFCTHRRISRVTLRVDNPSGLRTPREIGFKIVGTLISAHTTSAICRRAHPNFRAHGRKVNTAGRLRQPATVHGFAEGAEQPVCQGSQRERGSTKLCNAMATQPSCPREFRRFLTCVPVKFGAAGSTLATTFLEKPVRFPPASPGRLCRPRFLTSRFGDPFVACGIP